MRRTQWWRACVVVGSLAATLTIGAVLVPDYGQSWDEAGTAYLGRVSLRSYRTGDLLPSDLGDLARHGPFIAALVESGVAILRAVLPPMPAYYLRHFLFFLIFVGGLACMYGIARRWMDLGPALVLVAIMGTQPLLFGHGFINPNDGPFMSMFSATVLVGLWLGDSLARQAQGRKAGEIFGPPSARDFRREWFQASATERRGVVLWVAVFVAVTVDLLWLKKGVLPLLQDWVRAAYLGQAWEPINLLFRKIAEDASVAPLSAYYERLWLYYSPFRWIFVAGLGLAAVRLLRKVLPRFTEGVWVWWQVPWAVLGGGFLGAASAVRLIAPFAGALVSVLVVVRAKGRSLGALLVYWATAAVVVYATWPLLWGGPVAAYQGSLSKTFFGTFRGLILYEGHISSPRDLPPQYLASFIVFQTTLPLLALVGAGVLLSFLRPMKSRMRVEFLMIALWGLLPIAAATLLKSTAYDNGRHFLFVRPAIYLLAAPAIQLAWTRLRSLGFRSGLVVLALLPGFLGIVRLHPYEYAYFNEIVGGTRGAFRRFELDYWGLSYRPAVEFVNREASLRASVAFSGPPHLFFAYARQGLRIYMGGTVNEGEAHLAEYSVALTRTNGDLAFYDGAPIVLAVEVDGAVLAVVRELR